MILPTGPVTDAEIAQADLAAYIHAMAQPNGWRACLAIEEAWDLDGYPPQVVTEVLWEVANMGADFCEALDRALAVGE